MNKHTKLFLAFFVVFFSPSLIYAGSVDMTGYLPAPFGAYDQMRLVPRADSADAVCANGGSPLTGTMYMNLNGDIKICGSDGFWNNSINMWSRNAAYTWLKDSELPANAAWKVGIGVIAPKMKLHLAQDGGILAEGTFGAASSAVPPAGAGTRMLWYPGKAAFRAGVVGGSQWDDANIGPYSVAFGLDNLVSDDSTIAGGYQNTINPGFFTPTRGRSFIGAGANNSIGSTVRYSVIGGGSYNSISGNSSQSFIGSGGSNAAGLPSLGQGNTITDSPNSFIGNGVQNRILSSNGLSAIVSGRSNLIQNNTTNSSFIGGGTFNEIRKGFGTTITGGNQNIINSAGTVNYATIGGGDRNNVSGDSATIAGGTRNIASGQSSFVGGGGGAVAGNENTASGVSSTVSGGGGNIAGPGLFTTVGGGLGNEATKLYSTIGGGRFNRDHTFGVGSGYGTVAGGESNQAIGDHASVGGGRNNRAVGQYSTVSGGQSNDIVGTWSAISGGQANRIWGNYSWTVGQSNQIFGGSQFSGAIGNNHAVSGSNSFVGGRNITLNASGTFVWGSPGAATTVSTANSFVAFPANEGNLIIGTNANAAAGAPQNGPYKLYVNGKIGGRFDGVNVGELKLQYNNTPGQEGYYAVYAP